MASPEPVGSRGPGTTLTVDWPRAGSSMAEQAPFKRLVVGSSPTRLTIPSLEPAEADVPHGPSRPRRAAPGRRRARRAGGADWADLGFGSGAFTLALADLLGPGGRILSVDRDAGALREQARAMAAASLRTALRQVVADFTTDLPRRHGLPPLDGIVMANSLHFPADHVAVVRRVATLLRPGGRLVLVEYDADRGNPWVPHPLSFATWRRVAQAAGLTEPRLLGRVPSRFLGAIYSAVAERPARRRASTAAPRPAPRPDRCRCRPAAEPGAAGPAAPRRAPGRRRPARSRPGTSIRCSS